MKMKIGNSDLVPAFPLHAISGIASILPVVLVAA
jgi:hypothetical protein